MINVCKMYISTVTPDTPNVRKSLNNVGVAILFVIAILEIKEVASLATIELLLVIIYIN